MEKYLKNTKDKTVLDVGCGSGILAITAAVIGCDNALGIEIDEDAVNFANENIKRNGLEDRVKAIEGDLTNGIDYKADIVVANLTINLIEILTADVKKHLKDSGIYICSGILEEQQEQAEKILADNGFKVCDMIIEDEWCTICAEIQ